MRRLFFAVVLVLLLFVPVANAQYDFITPACPGMTVVALYGINERGDIVGMYATATDPNQHALIIRNGKCLPLGPGTVLQTKGSVALGINNHGDVVGGYFDGNMPRPPFHGFIFSKNGVLTTLDFPTADGTYAAAINESGQVVGRWYRKFGQPGRLFLFNHGYTWKDGQFSEFMVPGSEDTDLEGINAQGEYSGMWDPDFTGLVAHGFIFSKGKLTTYEAPFAGTVGTYPAGINDKGQIVGAYWNEFFEAHGFLKTGDQFTSIDYPGATMTVVQSLNNAGVLVGFYYDANYAQVGFVAIPKKE